MPTDGADFGRKKQCYGKAYTHARLGAAPEEVGRLLVKGLELDIRRDGGMLVFNQLVAALAGLAPERGGEFQDHMDDLRRQFADRSLTRHAVCVAEKISLDCQRHNVVLSEERAAQKLIMGLVESRGCEGMDAYVARNLTGSVQAASERVRAVIRAVEPLAGTGDLARRMLGCSDKGLPAKAVKGPRISHNGADLNNEVLAEP